MVYFIASCGQALCMLCMYVMYVCYVCMYVMYVCYVCMLCMYVMYVCYVCMLCMYVMYVCYVMYVTYITHSWHPHLHPACWPGSGGYLHIDTQWQKENWLAGFWDMALWYKIFKEFLAIFQSFFNFHYTCKSWPPLGALKKDKNVFIF